jgi:hypothetical protein
VVNPRIHQHQLRQAHIRNTGQPGSRAPFWTKRDYEMTAKCIRIARQQLGPQCDDKTANEITWEFCKLFKEDSPRFEELTFLAACSPSP